MASTERTRAGALRSRMMPLRSFLEVGLFASRQLGPLRDSSLILSMEGMGLAADLAIVQGASLGTKRLLL